MESFVIRFFVDGGVANDVIEAEDIADAVRQAHDKLVSPSFSTRDEKGNLGMTLSNGQVERLTIIKASQYVKTQTPAVKVERDTPRRQPRPNI